VNRVLALSTSLAVLLTSLAAQADESKPGSHTHDGFYLSLAAGVGVVHASMTTTANDLVDASSSMRAGSIATSIEGFAFSGHVLVGGTPFRGLAIGAGHSGNILPSGTRTWNGTSKTLHTYTFGVTGPFADWYPWPHGGAHVLAMAGFSDVIENASGGSSHGLFGFGGVLGLGYDVFVSDNWSLGILGRGMAGQVSWGAPAGVSGGSPGNPDLIGTGLHESQSLFGGALMITTTYQ
jgi:hypothetical protein